MDIVVRYERTLLIAEIIINPRERKSQAEEKERASFYTCLNYAPEIESF